MRKTKIKAIIHEDFHRILPKTAPKINLEEHVHAEQIPFATPPKQLIRRIAVTMMATLVVFCSFIAIPWLTSFIKTTTTTTTTTEPTSSDSTTSTNSISTTDTTVTTTDSTSTTDTTTTMEDVLDIDDQIVATQILTATKLSYTFAFSNPINLAHRLEESIFLMDDYIDWVNRYVNALESALVDAGGYLTNELESDDERYRYRTQSQTISLSGQVETYDLYYNIVSSPDDVKELSGIVVWKLAISSFVGTLKEENGETKLAIYAFETDALGDDYVFTEFKINDTDQKYKMNIVEDGATILESQIKFTVEADAAKITIDMDDGIKSIRFDIKRVSEDGVDQIKVNYRITTEQDSESGQMDIAIDNAESEYVYTLSVQNQVKVYRMPRVHSATENNDELSQNLI